MFGWLVRGLAFLVITFVVSATNQAPAAGFFMAILIFVLSYGACGLLNAVVRTVRTAWRGNSRAVHGNSIYKRLSNMAVRSRLTTGSGDDRIQAR